MAISPCSRLWTDINIHVHRKEITNCCRRRQKRIPTVEDFKTLGADFWLLRPEVKQDKEHFLEARDFPIGCGECGEYHPDSRYTTHNKWVDMDESFYENLYSEGAQRLGKSVSDLIPLEKIYLMNEFIVKLLLSL